MEKIITMHIIAYVIMVFSIISGIRGLATATSKKFFYIGAFIMHMTLAAGTKILMFIDCTPGITALNLTPMKLVNWYCLLISFCSALAVLIGILFECHAEKQAAAENRRSITKKD